MTGVQTCALPIFLESLDASQRATAIFDTSAPEDIVTMVNVTIEPLSPSGIMASALLPNQRDLLMRLIDVYAGMMAND